MQTASLKRILIITAVVMTATFLWAAAKPWLESPFRFSGWAVVFWPAVALTVSSAVAGLAWMMLDRVMERIAAILAAWATFVIFWSPDVWYVTMLPIFAGLWYLSAQRTHNDLTDRHKVRVVTSLGVGMTPMLLGTFVMLSLGFYLLPAYHNVGPTEVSNGIQGLVEGTYSQPLVEDQFAQMPAAMRTEVKAGLSKNIDDWVHKYLGPVGPYLPPILSFGLFLILWSVLFIFRELAIWLGALIFWGLKRVKFVRIEEKEVKADVLVL